MNAAPEQGGARWTGPPPLVMRCGAFGDVVLLTALLQHLQRRFGTVVDVIASGSWTAPLLEAEACVGRLFLVRSRRMPYLLSLDQQRLTRWLRSRGPGPAWFCDLGPGRELLRRGGVPDECVIDSRLHPWVPGESFADRYVRLGNLTPPGLEGRLPPPVPAQSRCAQLTLRDADFAALDVWLAARELSGRSYLVVHPGSRHVARRSLRSRTGASKYWPEERWAEVLRGLRAQQPDQVLLLTGTGAERRMNDDVLGRAAVREARNVAGELPVRTLLALLARAAGMVSIDTGPAHAAAALGCPTVALFATADPGLYRPGGALTPALAVQGELDGRVDLLGIQPGDVLRAWTQLSASLSGRSRTPQST